MADFEEWLRAAKNDLDRDSGNGVNLRNQLRQYRIVSMCAEARRYEFRRRESTTWFRPVLDGLAVVAVMWLLARVVVPTAGLLTGVLASTVIGVAGIALIRREGTLPVRIAAAVMVPCVLLMTTMWLPVISSTDPIDLAPKVVSADDSAAAAKWSKDAGIYLDIAQELYRLNLAQAVLQKSASLDEMERARVRVDTAQSALDWLKESYPDQYGQVETQLQSSPHFGAPNMWMTWSPVLGLVVGMVVVGVAGILWLTRSPHRKL